MILLMVVFNLILFSYGGNKFTFLFPKKDGFNSVWVHVQSGSFNIQDPAKFGVLIEGEQIATTFVNLWQNEWCAHGTQNVHNSKKNRITLFDLDLVW